MFTILSHQCMIAAVFLSCIGLQIAADSSVAVKLCDVKTLTLYNRKMCNARRVAPIPQLKCVGGSAGCNAFIPQVVQCYNKGTDGVTYQWECKADMGKAYRFGKTKMLCEGYSYPDDPVILAGSCGLEYTIEFSNDRVLHQVDNVAVAGVISVIIIVILLFFVCWSRSCISASTNNTTTIPPTGSQHTTIILPVPLQQHHHHSGGCIGYSSGGFPSGTHLSSGFGETTVR